MSAPSKSKLQIYDSWDLAKPKTSPRSRLYHLKPFGVGTARTESCTGYLARLAREHRISAHFLLSRELVPASNKPSLLRAESKFVSSGNCCLMMKSLNGRARTAGEWVEVLEKLTLRPRLRFLTMLTWRNVLTDQSLLRSVRAWCPECLEDQKEFDGLVYEYLLWTLATVSVCPHHQRSIESLCPHCQNQIPPFAYRSRPGFCSHCLGWLGHSECEKEANFSSPETYDFKYELWVANQLGELIAAAPKQPYDPPRERISKSIRTCIKRIADGNVTAFARAAGVNRDIVNGLAYKNSVPKTDALLKMCYGIGLSFSDFLTMDDVSSDIDVTRRSLTNNDVARLQFLAAIEEDPPPTLGEIADRLGYKKARSLRKLFPELTKLLTAKRRASLPTKRRRSRKKQHDDAGLKLALQNALEEEIPPPLDVLAESLGYSEARPIRKKFGSLCDAIIRRRTECSTDRLRIKLEAMLLEYPPPSLRQATNILGYKSNASLIKNYPALCQRVSARHTKYRKTQFENLHHELQIALSEHPPPPLRSVAARLGYTTSYLQKFPRACQTIVNRYVKFRKKSALERKANARERITRLALDLHAKGIYPSAGQLKRASNGPTGLDPSELFAVLRNVRRELGIISR